MIKVLRNKNFIFSLVLFLISFFIYWQTLAPSLYVEDSAEFVTAAAVMGIAHPPGYPLFTLIGKVFTLLPWGSIAFRVNLVSAFFAALTASILYLVFRRLNISSKWSFSVALNFAVTHVLWQEATYAEVYTLNLFFVALTLYFLVSWWFRPKSNFLLWFSFIYGLSLTNHFSMLAIAPAYGLLILVRQKSILKQWRLLVKMFLFFILPLSLYLYLPVRSAFNPPLDWYNPESPSGLYRVLRYDIATGHQVSLATGQYFGMFALNVFEQFGFILAGLGLLGLASTGLKNKKFFVILTTLILFSSLGVIVTMTNGGEFKPGIAWFLSIIYLPAYLFFSLFVALGLDSLARFFSTKKTIINQISQYILVSLLAVSFAMLLAANWPKVDKSQYLFVQDYYRNFLISLKPNAVVVLKDQSLNGDVETFSLLYFQAVEKLRPDVIIVSDSPIFYRPDILPLPEDYFKKDQVGKRLFLIDQVTRGNNLYPAQTIYTTFPAEIFSNQPVLSRSNGFAYQLFDSYQSAKAAASPADFLPLAVRNPAVDFDYYTREFLAKCFYQQASFYWERGDRTKGSELLQQAISLDPSPFSEEYGNFVKHRNNWFSAQPRLE